jgi:Bacterial protein of unknown function (Gcw_chp)
MRKLVLLTTAAVVLSTGLAYAADMPVKAAPPPVAAAPSMWDIAFGGALMTDYNFRGISQSDRGPAVFAYSELRFKPLANFEIYTGTAGWSVKLPTTPTGEFDFYGGIRPTFGPLAFDFGAIYYYYPNETQVFLDPLTGGATLFNTIPLGGAAWTLDDTDWWEAYGKVAYTWNDMVTLGAQAYYSPDWLKTGADGLYAAGTAKVVLPSSFLPKGFGIYLSGELGHYWLGTASPFFASIDLPDYTYWNLGVALTWKVFTFDVRYHDTDATEAECFVLTGDLQGLPGGGNVLGTSKWCGSAIIFKASADLTALTNLK